MEEKIIDIIAKYQGINPNEIKRTDLLMQDIGISSFDIMGLICQFEKEFEIEVQDREILKIRTIEDIINLIKNKKNI